MDITTITSLEDFQKVTENNHDFVVFKHSLTCPISDAANREFDQYSLQADKPLYRLFVQEARELSNYIADHYQIKHESPQVISFTNHEPTWNTSHSAITVINLKENI
ncbi:bacillithiol system redox-active protein YtxJ [Gracilibacillus caseinilyticus]|uniref:Bacillithiol system redox-active protein YtxJ n=1 Tax=Gracilibacillus caseinilyticus TaxID=2932256 RepID=A0ABY4ESF0_9BACI|nr:bacillithiol system redox-active protein YtxJ [Gracilibacillus caseinilyticus]UOQ47113.1 bacillithiol system redox-active protein YtxJ [Gracilibacillus caseinilyticus]